MMDVKANLPVKAVKYLPTGVVYFKFPTVWKHQHMIEDLLVFSRMYGLKSDILVSSDWKYGWYEGGYFSLDSKMGEKELITQYKRWEL